MKTATVFGSKALHLFFAVVAQLVEHFHGKEKVTGSIPVNGLSIQIECFV